MGAAERRFQDSHQPVGEIGGGGIPAHGRRAHGLAAVLQSAWSLPTALAFLAWYVFAPQCFATLATVRRETNSWRWTGFAFAYLFGLAYIAAGLVYHIASAVL